MIGHSRATVIPHAPKSATAGAGVGAARIRSSAELPTEYGHFRLHVFENDLDDEAHLALVHGDLAALGDDAVVPVRIHSECLTGDALGSLRCDCRAQLQHAQAELARAPAGILLYLRQEGRGIGLTQKIAAYALQDNGLDTVEANEHLGFDADLRNYAVAAAMLHTLGVRRVTLYTNNLQKLCDLEHHGIEVVERIPIRVGRRRENARYLDTKRDRCGHLL